MKPVASVAVGSAAAVGGLVASGAVDIGKTMIGLEPQAPGVQGLVGGLLKGQMPDLSGVTLSATEAIGRNGLYLAVPLCAALSMFGQGGGPLKAAVMSVLIGGLVKVLENAGITLPGVDLNGGTKTAFNRASLDIKPEELQPRNDNNKPAPQITEQELIVQRGLQAPSL